jgi:uncharacterized protein (DUF1810 family)
VAVGDPFHLERFIDAQERDGTYEQALDELRRGRKRSHWMWFVFPQVDGLGQSSTSRYFAITSLDEAQAYVRHPLLAARLRESIEALMGASSDSAEDIFGDVDAQKLRSSMTIFLRASPGDPDFIRVLDRYFDGQPDSETDRLLKLM